MEEIIKQLYGLTASELDYVIIRANILLEKKRKEEAEAARLERERQEKERLERERQERLKQEQEQQEKLKQERLRQQKIEELQRQLQELQNQSAPKTQTVPVVPVKPASEPARTVTVKQTTQSPKTLVCSHCGKVNVGESQFCGGCGQRLTAKQTAAPQSSQSAVCPKCGKVNVGGSQFCGGCGQRLGTSQSVQRTAPVQTPQRTAPVSQTSGQVRYVDGTVKQWVLEDGEKSVSKCREIALLKPDAGKKQTVYMEITNRRILLTRESTTSKNAGLVARMGGGIVGALIAEGIQSATDSGPKPWIEIPLTAVADCGVQNDKEFFIIADQTYVLKNKGYEKVLPNLVAAAKRNGR